MKLKDVEIQALLDAESSVSIAPNTDASDTTPKKNVLEVDTGLTVAPGKTLTFQSGIGMEVYSGKTLQVDGALTADSLQNDGTVAVTSGDTLRLRGNLTTSGTLSAASTGRVVVDGTFTRSGTLSLASGAAVLGGNKIEPDHVFAADTQPYAHWTVNGVDWEYEDSSKTIRIYGIGPTGDYTLSYSSATQETSTAPWASDLGQAETAMIEDGIPDSVTSIGYGAFYNCVGLKAITYTGDLAQWQALISASSGIGLPSGVTVAFTDGSTITT